VRCRGGLDRTRCIGVVEGHYARSEAGSVDDPHLRDREERGERTVSSHRSLTEG
jgi:hypothetical protein